MQSIAFDPVTVTIAPGQVVRWTNNDMVIHTVTSGNPGEATAGDIFDSGNLSMGQTYCARFNETGDFVYFCTIHPTTMLNAHVIVQ